MLALYWRIYEYFGITEPDHSPYCEWNKSVYLIIRIEFFFSSVLWTSKCIHHQDQFWFLARVGESQVEDHAATPREIVLSCALRYLYIYMCVCIIICCLSKLLWLYLFANISLYLFGRKLSLDEFFLDV